MIALNVYDHTNYNFIINLHNLQKSISMDSTFLPHANSLLIDFTGAIVSNDDYFTVSNLNTNPPGYTIWFKNDDGAAYEPKKVTHSGTRGFIFHYLDLMTPRPFDRERLRVSFLLPKFTGFEIFEISQVHTVLLLRVRDDCTPIVLEHNTPLCHVTWDLPSAE